MAYSQMLLCFFTIFYEFGFLKFHLKSSQASGNSCENKLSTYSAMALFLAQAILLFLHFIQPLIYWELRINNFKTELKIFGKSHIITLHKMICLFIGMDLIVLLILFTIGHVKCIPYLSNYTICDVVTSILAALNCHTEHNQQNAREYLIAD